MEGEFAWNDAMFGSRILKERFEQAGAFSISDLPADDPPAEYINDDVEVEACPFGGAHQLGDDPGPDLVRSFGEQFGLFVDGMA